MKRAKSNRNVLPLVVVGIGGLLIAVVAILFFSTKSKQQASYFSTNEVKLLEFDVSTGPVSPEYQESKTLILTPTTCSYTLTKIQPQSTTITNCVMNDSIWNQLVRAFDSSKVKDVLESAPQNSELIGGPQKQITAVYANGDTYKAFINASVKNQLESFLQQVQAQVPELSGFSF